MDYSDRELVCTSCGRPFPFSAGEQAYYVQNGLQDPRRCKPCRVARKSEGSERHRGSPPGDAPRGNRRPPPPARGGFRLASPDDPKGYRAPGFRTETYAPYVV